MIVSGIQCESKVAPKSRILWMEEILHHLRWLKHEMNNLSPYVGFLPSTVCQWIDQVSSKTLLLRIATWYTQLAGCFYHWGGNPKVDHCGVASCTDLKSNSRSQHEINDIKNRPNGWPWVATWIATTSASNEASWMQGTESLPCSSLHELSSWHQPGVPPAPDLDGLDEGTWRYKVASSWSEWTLLKPSSDNIPSPQGRLPCDLAGELRLWHRPRPKKGQPMQLCNVDSANVYTRN